MKDMGGGCSVKGGDPNVFTMNVHAEGEFCTVGGVYLTWFQGDNHDVDEALDGMMDGEWQQRSRHGTHDLLKACRLFERHLASTGLQFNDVYTAAQWLK